uniref:Uncharacterized protein isoform X2 n=2 Tax=Nicotiana TaxID=4085 RepID=A0A1S4CD42_TOBAC|nr:PREDICTED: uncharacterized protein LOC104228167 isoform X2 [Nicotiana sylvestris]XP_009778875.1 PREDICTED: uncharacterized protein LOC104228167 isoform X3 [Nicotiana sylvestris]XP_016499025.1 PREDICTED: uncharacterized protein LOC107817675 isoform X2 [Nicotiana tabacum]XP_016499026.1 PREDICTED: uncharacterized protein LOC107817675 isoform X3 [Nicotiana tabacum]
MEELRSMVIDLCCGFNFTTRGTARALECCCMHQHKLLLSWSSPLQAKKRSNWKRFSLYFYTTQAIKKGRDPTPSVLHLHVHTHGNDGTSFVALNRT